VLNYYDSGDQDSVVPLLGSRTLIRELADDLKFKITVPYGARFRKVQVFIFFRQFNHFLHFEKISSVFYSMVMQFFRSSFPNQQWFLSLLSNKGYSGAIV